MPSPRYPKVVRNKIASATAKVETVTMLLTELGKTWRRMMCQLARTHGAGGLGVLELLDEQGVTSDDARVAEPPMTPMITMRLDGGAGRP